MVGLIVTTLTGTHTAIDVDDTRSVQSIQRAIEEATSIPCTMQRILWKGKELALNPSGYLPSLADGDTLVVMIQRGVIPEAEKVTTPAPTEDDIKEGVRVDSRHEAELAKQLTESVKDLVACLTGVDAGPAGDDEGDDLAGELVLPDMDEDALAMLLSMGFPEERARKALYLNGMNAERSIAYLLTNGDDADIDEPLTREQIARVAVRRAAPGFEPDAEASEALMAMGFGEEEVTAALEQTDNDAEAAAAFLLGDRAVVRQSSRRIDETNPLIRAVLSNPAVEEALSNPRILIAFREIVSDPARTVDYINDPEIGPVLVRIHTIISNR